MTLTMVKENVPSKKISSEKTCSWNCAFSVKMQWKISDFVQFVVCICTRNVLDLLRKIQICSFVLNVYSNFMETHRNKIIFCIFVKFSLICISLLYFQWLLLFPDNLAFCYFNFCKFLIKLHNSVITEWDFSFELMLTISGHIIFTFF